MGLLAPFLLGEALKAFQDVEASIAQDYDQLKGDIQRWALLNGLTKFSMAQRSHNWT